MTLADIRSRLAGLEGRKYWRSLEELADTPEFRCVPRARVSFAGLRVHRSGRTPRVPQADGRVARARRRQLVHPHSRRENHSVRPPAGGDHPRPSALFRHGDAAGRLRHAGARRKPHGTADEDRGQPRTSGEPRRHRRLRPGVRPFSVRPGSLAQRARSRRGRDVGRLPRRDSSRGGLAARAARPGPAHSERAHHVAIDRRSDAAAHDGAARREVAPVGRRLRRRPGRSPGIDADLPLRQGRRRRLARRRFPRRRPGVAAVHERFLVAPPSRHAAGRTQPSLRDRTGADRSPARKRNTGCRSKRATFTDSRVRSRAHSAPRRKATRRFPPRRRSGSRRSRRTCRRIAAARSSSRACASRRPCTRSRADERHARQRRHDRLVHRAARGDGG